MQEKKTLLFLVEDLLDQSQKIPTLEIASVTNSSRDVEKNTLFLAYPGEKSDGRHYINDAITKGAMAVCYEPSDDFVLLPTKIPCIPIKNLKIKQSVIAARFYDFPSKKIPIVGVTGTNGKTSVTHFIAQSLPNCGVIGTIGYGFLDALTKTANTTPDGLQLQKIIATLVNQQAKSIAMEVSSHALSQQRVNDVQLNTAIFTNLTQDHLDFHHTMENYRDAKALLFQQPGLKNAVINIDDPTGAYFSECYKNTLTVLTYSRQQKQADIAVLKCHPTHRGFDLTVKTPWGVGDFSLPLIGEFNIENALATLGVLGIFKMSLQDSLKKLSQLKTVNGRMQLFHLPNHAHVIVDYAHTPDALEKALYSVRSHCHGKIISVFGCGGERDKSKRSKMGAIADALSDIVMITNDNPRSESPEAIAQDILQGVNHNNKFMIELDRATAIEKAIQLAHSDDWVLIAGKGHETEQVVGDRIMHHSDIECVLAQLTQN